MNNSNADPFQKSDQPRKVKLHISPSAVILALFGLFLIIHGMVIDGAPLVQGAQHLR